MSSGQSLAYCTCAQGGKLVCEKDTCICMQNNLPCIFQCACHKELEHCNNEKNRMTGLGCCGREPVRQFLKTAGTIDFMKEQQLKGNMDTKPKSGRFPYLRINVPFMKRNLTVGRRQQQGLFGKPYQGQTSDVLKKKDGNEVKGQMCDVLKKKDGNIVSADKMAPHILVKGFLEERIAFEEFTKVLDLSDELKVISIIEFVQNHKDYPSIALQTAMNQSQLHVAIVQGNLEEVEKLAYKCDPTSPAMTNIFG